MLENSDKKQIGRMAMMTLEFFRKDLGPFYSMAYNEVAKRVNKLTEEQAHQLIVAIREAVKE